jgi:hypothetical protein
MRWTGSTFKPLGDERGHSYMNQTPTDVEGSTPSLDQIPLPLKDVLITEQLGRRSTRPPDLESENAAYLALAQRLSGDPLGLLQALMDAAVSLCGAGTAGVSLLEARPEGDVVFRWTVLSGRLAAAVNGTTPRGFSPCGVCLDNDGPVLFSHPERRFTYFASAGVPFVEGLVLPFYVDSAPAGTIWIVSHDRHRRFDLEDVRIMSRLADFTGAAYGLLRVSDRSIRAVS